MEENKINNIMQKIEADNFSLKEKNKINFWLSAVEKYSYSRVVSICLKAGTTSEIAEKIAGEIIEVDKFGNLVTNIDAAVLTGHTDLMKIRLNNVGDIPFRRTFSEVPAQAPVAYIGSLGFLEIAINLERADEIMNANIGSMVEVIL